MDIRQRSTVRHAGGNSEIRQEAIDTQELNASSSNNSNGAKNDALKSNISNEHFKVLQKIAKRVQIA